MSNKFFNQKFVEMRVNRLSLDLPNKLNPRAALDNVLIKKLERSLLNLATDFSALNQGLVIITSDNHACLETGRNVVSIINGGHTYKAICNLRAKGELKSDPYIWVRLIQAESKDDIARIAECLNTSSKIHPRLLRNSDGTLDTIKRCLTKEQRERITWRTTRPVAGRTNPQLLIDCLFALTSGKNDRAARLTRDFKQVFEKIDADLTPQKLQGILTLMEDIARDLAIELPKSTLVSRVSILDGSAYLSAPDRVVSVAVSALRHYFVDYELRSSDLLRAAEYVKIRATLCRLFEENETALVKMSPAFVIRNFLTLLKKGKVV
jgi:hypothetical protein